MGRQRAARREPAFASALRRSLWQQASWLAGHLEWDLRANHLMRDLAGLATAGRFFAGADAVVGWAVPAISPSAR